MAIVSLSEKYEQSRQQKQNQNRDQFDNRALGSPHSFTRSNKDYNEINLNKNFSKPLSPPYSPILPKSYSIPPPLSPIKTSQYWSKSNSNQPIHEYANIGKDKPVYDYTKFVKDKPILGASQGEKLPHKTTNTLNQQSPIKRINVTPSRFRPTNMYKILNYDIPKVNSPMKTNNNGGILLNKNYKYASKNSSNYKYGSQRAKKKQISTLNPQNKGVFNKLRTFLTSFTNNDESEFDLLSGSAKEMLNIRSDPLPISNSYKSKRVNFDEQLGTPIKQTSPMINSTPIKKDEKKNHYEDDIDIVDDNLRINSGLRKRQELRDQISSLMALRDEDKQKYDDMKQKCDEMKQQFEHQFKLIKNNHEKEIISLNTQLKQLQNALNSREREIEQLNIQQQETFLIKQKVSEQDLAKREHQLKLQKRKLDEENRRLQEEKDRQSRQNEIDLKNHELIRGIKQKRLKIKDELKTQLHKNKLKFNPEFKKLMEQKLSINKNIDDNEKDFINFYEKVQKISENLLSKKVGYNTHESNFLNSLERLLNSLGELEPFNKITNGNRQCQLINDKLNEYSIFFEDFHLVYKTESPEFQESYNLQNMKGIETSFTKLKSNLHKKFFRKCFKLKNLDIDISRLRFKLSRKDFLSDKMHDNQSVLESTIEAFEHRSSTLQELMIINTLSLKVNELSKQLADINTIIKADARNNDDDDDDIVNEFYDM